jgi:hypothetical protein
MTRKQGMSALAAALFLPSIGLGIWYAVSRPPADDSGIRLVLQDAGYYQLTPPSRLFPPGTYVTLATLPDGSLSPRLTCTMNREALEALGEKSVTFNRSLISSMSNAFDAVARALTAMMSKTTGDRVRKIAMSLNDMHIFTMSRENLIKVRNQYLKGSCEQAIGEELQAGAEVCQTEEVLQADVAYRMSFREGISGEEKASLAKQFVEEAKLVVDKRVNDEMLGEDLYFGIKISRRCILPNNEKQRLAASNSR